VAPYLRTGSARNVTSSSVDAPCDEPVICTDLLRSPEAGAIARGLISRHLAPRLSTECLLHAKLVTSELVNNAYQHGEGAIRLEVAQLGDRLRIEVVDHGFGASIKINEEPASNGGRGLRIVDSLALQWGAYEGTTHVWADLPL
jgi:anti-sigma regulatory factor (Ser/Thr protein kinase)